ncbi:Flagellar synthesis regulator FleN, partial [hydrothermal vent metagenome]
GVERGASPRDQASRLRALVEAMSGSQQVAHAHTRRVPVIAIASGKGGVGKTNLAVNLSIALTQAGRGVSLLDADLGMANADVVCGLTPGRRLDDVLCDPAGPGLASCIVRAPGGFWLVPGAVGVARIADLDAPGRQRLVDQLETLESRSDVVLIDTGAGIGRDVLAFATCADWLLVVVTPEPTSITDAYGLIKCVVARSREQQTELPRIAMVVNEVHRSAEANAVSARLAATCERFLGCRPELLGYIRRDDRVGRAVRRREPHLLAWPRTAASRDVRTLATRLVSLVWTP